MTVQEKAKFVRSKNAGPFWVTMDIFAETEEDYRAIKQSSNMTREKLGVLLNTETDLVKLFFMDSLMVIKISIPRKQPQGSRYERDMHAGQQYIPLMDYEL